MQEAKDYLDSLKVGSQKRPLIPRNIIDTPLVRHETQKSKKDFVEEERSKAVAEKVLSFDKLKSVIIFFICCIFLSFSKFCVLENLKILKYCMLYIFNKI